MDDLELLTRRLKSMQVREIRDFAVKKNLPFQTLYNIRAGITKNPRFKTVKKACAVFLAEAA